MSTSIDIGTGTNTSQSGLPIGAQSLPPALGGGAPAGAPAAPAGAPAAPAGAPAAPAGGLPGQEGAPTLPASPAAPVALETETPAPVEPNADTSEEFSYDSTGDAGLDYALNFVGKLGYGDAHPAILAAQKGDFSLLKAELGTKGVPGVDAVVALAEQAYSRFAQEDAKKSAELASFAAQAAGGQENWATVRAWAAQEATPQEKAQVNAALAQGGLVAQGVIGQLVSLYQQKHTLPKSAGAVTRPGAAGTNESTSGPMTAQVYSQAVEALRKQFGGNIDGRPEYSALQAQRLAAKRAGY